MDDMPDLSHLTEDERKIIQQVLNRQKVEESKEHQVQAQYEKELEEVERQINDRKELAGKQIGTQSDAICQICQKTKFADGIGHKCYYCQLRSCARCGGRTQIKVKNEQKISLPSLSSKPSQQNGQRNVWACSLCQKKQQIFAKTGKWFHQEPTRPTTPTYPPSPTASPTPSCQTPGSFQNSVSQEFDRQFLPDHQTQPQRPQMGLSDPISKGSVSMTQQSRAEAAKKPRVTSNFGQAVESMGVALDQVKVRRQQNLIGQPSLERRSSVSDDHQKLDNSDDLSVARKFSEIQSSNDKRRNSHDFLQQSYAHQSWPVSLTDQSSNYENNVVRKSNESVRCEEIVSKGQPAMLQQTYGKKVDMSERSAASIDRLDEPREKNKRHISQKNGVPLVDDLHGAPCKVSQKYEENSHVVRHPYDESADGHRRGWVEGEGGKAELKHFFKSDACHEEQVPVENSATYSSRPVKLEIYKDRRQSSAAMRRQNEPRHTREQVEFSSDTECGANIANNRRNARDFREPHKEQQPKENLRSTSKRSSQKIGEDRKLSKYEAENEKFPEHSRMKSPSLAERRRLPRINDERVVTSGLSSELEENISPSSSPLEMQDFRSSCTIERYERPESKQHRKPNIPKASKSSHVLYNMSKRPLTFSSSEDEFDDVIATTSDYAQFEANTGSSFIRSVIGNQRSKSSSDVETQNMSNLRIHKISLLDDYRQIKQLPATWHLDSDGSHLIGRIILKRKAGVSLGLKVTGGRLNTDGQLSAFITTVKQGSLADTVAKLRAGDEVLEWNKQILQNVSFDKVCQIINESKYDDQISLIVSRAIEYPSNLIFAQDFYPTSQLKLIDAAGNVMTEFENLSVTGAKMSMPQNPATTSAPFVLITAPHDLNFQPMLKSPAPLQQGRIFGTLEVALLYSAADEQLVITVYQAIDLPPRSDGALRNPYVKIFLLPDRSEKSRRQSNILANTCRPVWQQSFIYQNVTAADLTYRVLELTLWDYDQFVTNDFLGEVLFDLLVSLFDNEPRWYTLTDLNEESPIRAQFSQKLREHASAYSRFSRSGFQLNEAQLGSSRLARSPSDFKALADRHCISSTFPSLARSHTYNQCTFQDQPDTLLIDPASFDDFYDDPQPFQRMRGHSIDDESVRLLYTDLAAKDTCNVWSDPFARRYLPVVPPDPYGDDATAREFDDEVQQLRSQGFVAKRHRSAQARYAYPTCIPDRHEKRRRSKAVSMGSHLSRQAGEGEPRMQGGYLSDGSETSMSITSTQSEHPRARPLQAFHQNMESTQEESFELQDGTVSDSAMISSTGNSAKSAAFAAEAKRKKSLMTRLIPGRGNAANALQDQKRLGFRRSDEVGIPSTLSPQSSADLVKQPSKESTDSSDSSWLPKISSEGCLGEFVPGLGPGQVVGRQVLASPCMGEMLLRLIDKNNCFEVVVVQARNLVKKPAPYVKVYLMDGKHCIAKAKTNMGSRCCDPQFDQMMVFAESYKGKLLQISVWGDYGRMERRIFMGISLLKLDKLDLSNTVEGWYKLYHANSLVGTASPARKDSENSTVVPESTTIT